jgi:Rrf2 family nitric oxide-sensitive transcriptional repressor
MRELIPVQAMRLTQWTDYSLRMLMFCAIHQERPRAPTVGEIAQAHGISRSHLTKIAMTLAAAGLLETTRGRHGGLRLLKPADQIRVGDVLRITETDFKQVECFDAEHNSCRITGACRLKDALTEAMNAYLAVLDACSLADMIQPAARQTTARIVSMPVSLPAGLPDAMPLV